MSRGLEICEKMCNECLFTPNRIVSAARKEEVIATCLAQDTHFLCHKGTQKGVEVMCRGWYNTQPPSQLLVIAQRLGVVHMVPIPDGNE